MHPECNSRQIMCIPVQSDVTYFDRVLTSALIMIMNILHMHTHSYLQEPEEIKIGDTYQHSIFTGAKRRIVEKQDTYQYVPLLASLHSLLFDPSIVDQVEQCPTHIHTDGILEDVCDGTLFTEHPLFASDPYAFHFLTS